MSPGFRPARGSFMLRIVFFAAVGFAGCDRPGAPESQPAATAARPKRIISISPDATEMIAMLGRADVLVGVCDFCVWPEESVRKLPRVGGFIDPNLETILRLSPDALILRGGSPELERLCRQNGIRLVRDPTERFDQIAGTARMLGELLDAGEAAERVVGEMNAGLAAVEEAVSQRTPPRVFFCIARKPDTLAGISTAGKDTFVDELIRRAGGRNIFGDSDVPYPQVSLEQILHRQPEIIIEAMEARDVDADTARLVGQQWKALGDMPATRDGRIHVLTEDNLLIPSPRVVESVRQLARLFHPEATLDE